MALDANARALSLVERSALVDLSTLQADGWPETRAMFNLRKHCAEACARGPASLSGSFAAWIGTNTASRKTAQIRSDGRACLYYRDDASFEGLTLRGRAIEIADRAVKAALWRDDWDRYYAGGLDGGDFSVFRFVPESGRYYAGLEVAELRFDAEGALLG